MRRLFITNRMNTMRAERRKTPYATGVLHATVMPFQYAGRQRQCSAERKAKEVAVWAVPVEKEGAEGRLQRRR